ncbi:hypothetical protein NLU13_9606 [Sarocladium strictum]|uniref:Poly [ADP-ribose] polymerase n=1 Tax=Sarocladium strictum TaxID=5046 RepID=A0AA39GAF1_SARSR|nr:hypothetical protein NLU13_9606 [Sarocladium strictum]
MAQTRKSRAAAGTASKADAASDTVTSKPVKDHSNGAANDASKSDSDNKGKDGGDDAPPSKDSSADAGPKTSKPFKGCVIFLSGNFVSIDQSMLSMKKLVREFGGMNPSSITQATTHIICTSHELKRRRHESVQMKIPVLKPEWVVDCALQKRRLPESDYLWDYSEVLPTGETLTSADILAAAISEGLIISPANDIPPDSKTGKRARGAACEADIKAEDTEEEKPKAKKTKTAAKAPKSKTGAKKESKAATPVGEETEDGELAEGQFAKRKDMVIPIDEFCPLPGYQVYIDQDSGMIYDASLNQSNATHNNNKFYRDQVVVDTKSGTYKTWTRWGRVGDVGQSAMLGDGSLADAIKLFEKKFKDKSGLAWSDRGNDPKPGKYAFVERSYNPDSDDEGEEVPQKTKVKGKGDADEVDLEPPSCTLEKPIQDLVELIFNTTYMQNAMAALNYDANKLPLGKLSKNTITRGFQQLKDLAALLNDPTLATSKWQMTFSAANEHLSNTYYSLIPHDFRRQRPPVIADHNLSKKEVELLESLSDMKDAADIMKIDRKKATVHPTDLKYQGLGMKEMTTLDPTSTEFSLLEKYLNATRGSTHNVNYEVQNIWRIERPYEYERFDKSPFASIESDRRLLWHGSRCTNFGGILSQGLRIAPPEAPVSGYMFGKGIYLADMSSKSANYCCAYNSNGHALLLLCDAELGKPMQELTNASYNAGDTAKADGKVATHGLGRIGPSKWIDAGAVHPSLKGVKMPDPNHIPGNTKVSNASLYYNEYIAYDVAQVRLRYLLRVKM